MPEIKQGSEPSEQLGLDSTLTGGAEVIASVAPEAIERLAMTAAAPDPSLISPKTTPSSPRMRARVPSSPATEPTEASVVGAVPQPADAGALFAPPQPITSPPNTAVVAGRYKRLFTLGTGGLGEVEACEDLLL